jgi:hypothetical protein
MFSNEGLGVQGMIGGQQEGHATSCSTKHKMSSFFTRLNPGQDSGSGFTEPAQSNPVWNSVYENIMNVFLVSIRIKANFTPGTVRINAVPKHWPCVSVTYRYLYMVANTK